MDYLYHIQRMNISHTHYFINTSTLAHKQICCSWILLGFNRFEKWDLFKLIKHFCSQKTVQFYHQHSLFNNIQILVIECEVTFFLTQACGSRKLYLWTLPEVHGPLVRDHTLKQWFPKWGVLPSCGWGRGGKISGGW